MGKKKNKKKQTSRKRSASRKPVSGAAALAANDVAVTSVEVDETERYSRWGLLLSGLLIFLIATPAIVGPYGQTNGYTPDLHMAAYVQVGAMVLLSLFVFSTFFREQIRVPRSPMLLPLLIFYAWAMLSVLWADTKYEAVVDALDWTGAFLCAMLIVLLLRDVRLLMAMMFFLFLSGLVIALFGIGQYLFGIDWVQQHIVPAATFSNKNMAGQYGVLTFPLAVAFFLHSRNTLRIWFFAGAAALIMVYVFYTRSRGAWVGFGVDLLALAAVLFYLKRKHGWHLFGDMPVKKVASASALALFLGMSYLTPGMLGNTDKVMEASIGADDRAFEVKSGVKVLKGVADNFMGSADTRVTMWANSIPMFRDHFLFGVGLGNWTIHYAKYQSWFKQDRELTQNRYHANAHNDYVEILCELGIIGFALFAWVVVALFRVIGRLLSSRNEEYFVLTVPLAVAIVGISSNAVFSFPLKQPVPIFLVLVYMAVLSNLYGTFLEKGRDYVLPALPVPAKALIAGILVAATVGVFSLQRDWYQSELHYRNAVTQLRSQGYRVAYNEAKQAYALNPLRANLLWIEATALMQLGRKGYYDRAIENFKEVERTHPYSSSTIQNLTNAYSKAGRHEEAAKAFGRLVSVQPSNFELRYRYGVYLFNAGRVEEALEEFEKRVQPYYKHRHDVFREQWLAAMNNESVSEGVKNHLKQKVETEQRQLSQLSQLIAHLKSQRRLENTVKAVPEETNSAGAP